MTNWRIVLAGLMAFHVALIALVAYVHSPVASEVGHLPAGISHWEFGRFDLYRVNPPLVRMVAALPVLLEDPVNDWESYDLNSLNRTDFAIGRAFVAANGPRSIWLFTLGRWACIPFSLIGAYVCFRWANDLYGVAAGFVAYILWCFSPNLLGHGALLMPDVPAAALGLAACYAFWCWMKRPAWTSALILGIVMGLAELTKTTLIIFYPLWPMLWVFYRLLERDANSMTSERQCDNTTGTARPRLMMCRMPTRAWWREAAMLGASLAVSLAVLNLVYGFEGSFRRLGDYKFQSRVLSGRSATDSLSEATGNRFAGSWLASVPVPLPNNYVKGIDIQKGDFDAGLNSYLAGSWSNHGWWYFYLFAAMVKVPLGTWLMGILAAGTALLGWRSRAEWRDEMLLLLPLLVIVLVVSLHTGFSVHFRYVFPAFPFAFILASRWAAQFGRPHPMLLRCGAVALIWMLVSSLATYPHSLSYFNELAGGPRMGPRYLLDSNIDWGQDLLYLKKWLNQHPEANGIRIAYFGPCDLEIVGLNATSPPEKPMQEERQADLNSITGVGPSPGWFALSVNLLYDRSERYDYFLRLRPVAMAGYSIYIYHITAQDANRLRDEMDLPPWHDIGVDRRSEGSTPTHKSPPTSCRSETNHLATLLH